MQYELPPGVLKSAIRAPGSALIKVDAQSDFVGDINPDFDWGIRALPPTFMVMKTINPFDQDGEAATGPLFDPNDRFCLRPDIAAELERFAAEVDRLPMPNSEVTDAD